MFSITAALPLALFSFCLVGIITALPPIANPASKTPPPNSLRLQFANGTLGSSSTIHVPGTSTVLHFEPSYEYLNPRAVSNLVVSSLLFILEQKRIHGDSSLIIDSGQLPDGLLKRDRGEGCRLAVIPLYQYDLTWRVLNEVVEGLRIWEIDSRNYAVARFTYELAGEGQGYGYLVPAPPARSGLEAEE